MLLARSNEYPESYSTAPCALFLTEGPSVPKCASELLKISHEVGFLTVAAPWFCVHATNLGVFATGGRLLLTAREQVPITEWFWLRPRVLVPLFFVDDVTRSALRRLAQRCPNAVVTFHPSLRAVRHSSSKTQREVIPAYVQALPRDVRVCMADGPERRQVEALLQQWWGRQLLSGLHRWHAFPRLLLFANLHVRVTAQSKRIELRHVDLLPCGGFESETGRPFWLERATSCLQLAYRRALKPPAIVLPTPGDDSYHYSGPFLASDEMDSAKNASLLFPEFWFAREEGRMRLRCDLAKILADGESCVIRLCHGPRSAYRGISICAQKSNSQVSFDFKFDYSVSLSNVAHPLSSSMPSLGGGHCYVETSARHDARTAFLDPCLVGPKLAGDGYRKEPLIRYVGRCVSEEVGTSGDPLGRRYVEPGIGRGYLVDFLRLSGHPEFYDFSVIGGGLTPYSRHGYIHVGRPIDGKVSLGRALHRQQCGERLANAGCRVSRVVAIIALQDDQVVVPDGGRLPAALVVRGFRSVLRVRQLDPIACLYHSAQARSKVASFLADARWNLSDEKLLERSLGQEEQRGQKRLRPIRERLLRVGHLSELVDRSRPQTWAEQSRLRAIRMYGPLVLEIVKMRVAIEVGRDPISDPLSSFEYAQWFASTMGRQLALFRRLRFLHDYHQDGISFRHQLPPWLYSLAENNITLMAEFPDLETGVFVDLPGADSSEELRLTRRDWALLSTNFNRFHGRDVHAARSSVRAVVTIVCHDQSVAVRKALGWFESEYERVSRLAWSRP
jgi:Protein adenylyltransferase SelO